MDHQTTKTIRLLALVGLLVLFPACRSSSEIGSPSAANAQGKTSIREMQYQIPKERLAEVLKAASPLEKSILEDGVISFAEYEAATFSAIKCFTERGFSIIPGDGPDSGGESAGPRLTRRGRYSYSPVSPPGFDEARFSAVVAECKTPYATIEFLWAAVTSPTAKEVIEARQSLANCLRESGSEVPNDASAIDRMIIAFPPDGKPHSGEPTPEFYIRCARQAAEEYDLPGFIG
jgi:hypothetical protein